MARAGKECRLNQEKKYFCFSNRLFLQSRSPRVGRVGRCVFTATVFGMRFFLSKNGVNEEKIKRKIQKSHTVGKGGWTSVRDERKGEKGGRGFGKLQECYVYLAEWLEARTQPSHPPMVNCVSGEESGELV